MTLRARLLIGLLLLTAVALAVAGTVTYQELHTSLIGQVDNQLTSIERPVLGTLNGPDDVPRFGSDRFGLPVGTYGQLRDSSGAVVNEFIVHLSSVPADPAPHLANQITVTGVRHWIAPAVQGSLRYRVMAVQLPDGGTLIVALPLREADATLRHLLFVELAVGLTALVGIALLAWWVVKFGLRPLKQMEETAGAIAAGDLSQRVETVDEHTEVGRLGVALNKMLHEIEVAFDERTASENRLRQFIADASHELRTPLTSIRGYAELFRRGAADRPEDLAKAMRRIEEEASRMGVLVDDLLLLARLDQGRPVERNPVDLTRITSDAVDDARAVAPDRPIDYSPNGAIIVPGDEARLRQVLGNLLQNANKYTPPQSAVHVRITSDDENAVIEVADEGPGMEPEVAQHVFERFWRTDPSRTRASGGAGLGLAIVAAIAHAHGGRAELETEPGHGATFRIWLPRTMTVAAPAPNGDGVGRETDATAVDTIEVVEMEETNAD